MVPVLEPSGLPGRRTANGYLQKGFPIWTRGDDSDDESADSESLEAHRPRARRQDASASNFKDKKAVEPTGYYLAKKGLLKDLAEPVISGFLSAIKGGKDSSPSSGDEDDSDNNKEDNKDKPKDLSDIPPQPPPVTEPPAPLPSAEPAVKPPPSQPLFSFPAVASPEPKTSQSEKGSPDQPAPVPMSSSAAQPKPSIVVAPIQPPKASTTAGGSIVQQESKATPAVAVTTTSSISASRSILSLTPIVTGPVPGLSSDARKGVDYKPTPEPIVTLSTSPSPTMRPTSSADGYDAPAGDKSPAYGYKNHGDFLAEHSKKEKALMAVGGVGGTILVAFLCWLAWRCYKRRGTTRSREWRQRLASKVSFDKPKLAMTKALSHIPIYKKRANSRGWSNLDKASLGPFDEKSYVISSATASAPTVSAVTSQPGMTGITIQTDITRESMHNTQEESKQSRHVPNQSISSIEAQFNNTLRSGAQPPYNRLSDISSLSSGFGDGILIVTPSDNIATVNTVSAAATMAVQEPEPTAKRSSTAISEMSRRRDTVYTEASEDSPPRFRTINSWVRQQTGRVKRAKRREVEETPQDAPPMPQLPLEQDLGLMMPDGEVPRRVELGGGYGVAR